jgi:hypothetical protein
MTKKIFPIATESACLLKWNWSTIYFQSGSSSSCHRTQKYAIDPDNFFNFHNLPAKVQARTKMLNGQWPGAGCEYCKNAELHGTVSDRQFQLEQLQDTNLVPPELLINASSTEVTPTIVEVYFNNTCNMACIYCGPHHSSKWVDENKKYGNFFANESEDFSVVQEQKNIHYDKMVKDFWNYLGSNNRAQHIQRYHMLGGEPFLLKEFDDSIKFWARYGHPDLQISIVSNLNIPHDRFKSYIEKFRLLAKHKKMWRLQLTASLDCWGPEQEHSRYGLDLSLWQKNFEYILNTPWILPSINSAISALTIKSMPALVEKINHWNCNQDPVVEEYRTYNNLILHSFNTSNGIDNPYMFGDGVFDHEFDQAIALMPATTDSQKGQKQMMISIAQQQKQSVKDHSKVKKLKEYLDVLDQRRGTNWRSLYQWLDALS